MYVFITMPVQDLRRSVVKRISAHLLSFVEAVDVGLPRRSLLLHVDLQTHILGSQAVMRVPDDGDLIECIVALFVGRAQRAASGGEI